MHSLRPKTTPPALSVLPGGAEATPQPPPLDDPDIAASLGLYLGYDRARVALGRLAAELERSQAAAGLEALPPAQRDEIERGARAAALAAFALVCDHAEGIRSELCQRWPELREDCGGPLPVRESDRSRDPLNGVHGSAGTVRCGDAPARDDWSA